MGSDPQLTTGGVIVAPHHLAADAGQAVLHEGGNAIEAMIAAASTIAVVYPHMNSLGGDGFWTLHEPGGPVRAIDACGAAAGAAEPEDYRERGLGAIPFRGSDAALTVAGTVSGWSLAETFSRQQWGGTLPLERLLADAIAYAEDGCPVTASQAEMTHQKLDELEGQPGFGDTYLVDGAVPPSGSMFRQPRLGRTLRRLAAAGLDDFYRGQLARELAGELASAGSPLRFEDLSHHAARMVEPVSVALAAGTVYNTPPPTQGLASAMILGLLERFGIGELDPTGPAYVHAVVEATKLAFEVRNAVVADPLDAASAPARYLTPDYLDRLARRFDPHNAMPWPLPSEPGDTVWLGAIDRQGRAVSFIQSIYHEFGSGVVLPSSGICWQNRGCSFGLDPQAPNGLRPGRKPFHTLNPPIARLRDGRTFVYGTMGGDGQPQTQAAVFTRYVYHGQDLAAAIDAPRWLLGRTWGQSSETLKLESRFAPAVGERLADLGHRVEVLTPYNEAMGHAGALALDPDGRIEAAADPRSDGKAAGL